MFRHVEELQFSARVSGPDPHFARLLLEQFGGGNGELKAAMQYFIQAFSCRRAYPDKYDLLMDIVTEEFSHLDVVGATITMLLEGINGELKNAIEKTSLSKIMNGKGSREQLVHEALTDPQFLVLTGGGPRLTDAGGVPWTGQYINANGDMTVDLRSDIAAESRAKIVYEYLMQFTDDPLVKESLGFLMTREIAHFQMFSAALAEIPNNFPPGVLQGDPRYTHTYFNLSEGMDARGPWNEGDGPWEDGGHWRYVEEPISHVRQTQGLVEERTEASGRSPEECAKMDRQMSRERRKEVTQNTQTGTRQWSEHGGRTRSGGSF